MSRAPFDARPHGPIDRPTYQWETGHGGGPLALRLFGTLGRRELARVADALAESGASPRDSLQIDFENADHLDYRALLEFTATIQRLRNRGASIWFVGLSPYLRSLFHVAGQGPALSRLEWRATEFESAGFAHRPGGIPGAVREAAWDRARL